ncbi:MAG: hypothetical protein ACLFTV_12155, partial [Desulfococcaceae bacterium]
MLNKVHAEPAPRPAELGGDALVLPLVQGRAQGNRLRGVEKLDIGHVGLVLVAEPEIGVQLEGQVPKMEIADLVDADAVADHVGLVHGSAVGQQNPPVPHRLLEPGNPLDFVDRPHLGEGGNDVAPPKNPQGDRLDGVAVFIEMVEPGHPRRRPVRVGQAIANPSSGFGRPLRRHIGRGGGADRLHRHRPAVEGAGGHPVGGLPAPLSTHLPEPLGLLVGGVENRGGGDVDAV